MRGAGQAAQSPPLWHVDYSDRKTTQAPETQEEPLPPYENVDGGPFREELSPERRCGAQAGGLGELGREFCPTVSAGLGNLFIQHLLFHLPVNLLPFEAQPRRLLPSSAFLAYEPFWPDGPRSHIIIGRTVLQGPHTYVIKFVFLL